MPADLTPVIAACTRWLLAAYPPSPGALNYALAEAQARQAATLAAHLRHPTALDVQLLHLLGPGGTGRLDWLTAADLGDDDGMAWRTWVDETVVSWAACLLADPALSGLARQALERTEHRDEASGLRRLTVPGPRDSEAAALLRHPDLLEGIAGLHRDTLLALLDADSAALP
ncbi:hypothetical protein ACH4E7_40120 [Kitasatospora sp. NPDC018058]|uniref:hypothetical protein n=1 Tax=Kitasatospora sp. NPDC018058 TaxID=3364025 RepID=UPI0037C1B079